MPYQILQGDVLNMLRTLPDNHFHCVVTSPPYWGLRDYGEPGQIGLEPTPQEYVAKMVEVFREVRRVLRDDGCVFLNLGDTYSTNGGSSIKPKDLVGIPWRVAFALQDDGWYLRADNIWHKPNPMPEAVTDRTTKSHEYVFHLTKKPQYFYDAEAIKETAVYTAGTMRFSKGTAAARKMGKSGQDETASNKHRRPTSRNRRSVWTITTQSFKGAHFATFPEDLPRICILAGTSEKGCCKDCGRPYTRIIARKAPSLAQQQACGGNAQGEYHGQAVKEYTGTGAQNASDVKRRILKGMRERKTVGWHKHCACVGRNIVPCRVLDIFNGSGTTGAVAVDLGRDYVGLELNPEYIPLAHERIAKGVRKRNKKKVAFVEPEEASLPL